MSLLAGVDVPMRTQVRRERAALDAVHAAAKALETARSLCEFAGLDSREVCAPLDTARLAVGRVVLHLERTL